MFALVFLGACSGAWAQGELRGEVVDESGRPVAEALLIARLPGQRIEPPAVHSDARGRFVFPALPPGDYTLRVSHPDFATLEHAEIPVWLDRATGFVVEMLEGEPAEEVLVATDPLALDPVRTGLGRVERGDELGEAAVGVRRGRWPAPIGGSGVRLDLVALDAVRLRALSGAASENVFVVDGFETTDPADGGFAGELPFDALDSVALHLAGPPAGRIASTGSTLRAATQRAGRRWTGSLDLRGFADGWSSDRAEHGDGAPLDGAEQNTLGREQAWSASAHLGGPIFDGDGGLFLAVSHLDDERSAAASPLTRRDLAELWLVRLDRSLSDSTLLSAWASGDPMRGEVRDATGRHRVDRGGGSLRLALDTVLEGWSLSAGAATSRRADDLAPRRSDREREQARLDVARALVGRHTLRAGGRVEATSLDGDLGLEPALERAAAGRLEGDRRSAWIEDLWTPTEHWTLRAGVRWDAAEVDRPAVGEPLEIDEVQPRVGLGWDPRGDGRTRLRASWGRFVDVGTLRDVAAGRRAPVREETWTVSAEQELARATTFEVAWVEESIEPLDGSPPAGFAAGTARAGEREATAWIVRFDSRALDLLHLTASATWSDAEGDLAPISGFATHLSTQLDPLRERPLLQGRRSGTRVDLSGFVQLPRELTLGIDAFWSDESVADGRLGPGEGSRAVPDEAFAVDTYQVDVQLARAFSAGGWRMELVGAVLNVFDRQEAIDFCQEADGCLGLEPGAITDRQDPRRFELAVRWEL
ncbi:MAG: TonB-dependent receptor [Acidobacteriota bacterium]